MCHVLEYPPEVVFDVREVEGRAVERNDEIVLLQRLSKLLEVLVVYEGLVAGGIQNSNHRDVAELRRQPRRLDVKERGVVPEFAVQAPPFATWQCVVEIPGVTLVKPLL